MNYRTIVLSFCFACETACQVCLLRLVDCLTPQQHASASQGRICSDNITCCHTEIEVADQTFHLTQSQHTDTGTTSPSTDPITPGAWQGSHWSANFEVTGMTRPRKNPVASGNRTRDLPLSRRTPKPLGQRGGRVSGVWTCLSDESLVRCWCLTLRQPVVIMNNNNVSLLHIT